MDGAGAEATGMDEQGRRERARAAEQADREFEDAIASLAGELAELRRDFVRLVDQMGRVGEAGKQSARAAVRAAGSEGFGASQAAQAELGGEFRALREELVRTARTHPWRTLGLAAVAGVVVGLFVRR